MVLGELPGHAAARLEQRGNRRIILLQTGRRGREAYLAQVFSGKLNKQIAADIGAAERTVKAHRAAGSGGARCPLPSATAA
jgi:FixJ family two-component response regulator